MSKAIYHKISFNNKLCRDFTMEVKQKVNAYFEDNQLSKHANAAMVTKTIVILSSFWGSYALIMSGIFPLWVMWLLSFIMGLSMAGIGFSISHDALHGAYSSNKTINTVLGFTFDMLGANGYIWKITHNIIHHTYTNIHGHDGDLDIAGIVRLSPHSKHLAINRIQHILAFFVYSLATIFWVIAKDFIQFSLRRLVSYENKKHPIKEWIILFITKIIYFSYIIVAPLYFLDITFLQWLIGFLTLHLTAGLILGVIFQLAHVVEETEHPMPNDEMTIENHWLVHEMLTTSNFARKNKVLSWYIGGLNYQIEHHLFPCICSIHYPEISHIVEETANKYGIPYKQHGTFTEAVVSHYRTLKKFGRPAFQYVS